MRDKSHGYLSGAANIMMMLKISRLFFKTMPQPPRIPVNMPQNKLQVLSLTA
jgi:hypothetical protein